jgi:DNA-binding transcriptional regulator YdaS (Cro superfamily)
VKHPLRRALASVGMTHDDVAARLSVDPKTVERWCAGRVPYPNNRAALAELTGWPEHDLWPDAVEPATTEMAGEVITTYPHRFVVPSETWRYHFARAEREIGILVYSGLFLAEDAGVVRILGDKAHNGVSVRILLGDPDSSEVAQRGTDEGVADAMAARIRNTLVLLRPLVDVPGVAIRLHRTTLYNSIYRADDNLLVNPHVYGLPASTAPVHHVRRVNGGMLAATYLLSFERVWESARNDYLDR